jgi:AP-3 complex subunit beta
MFPQFTNTAASLTRATALIHRVGTDAYLYDDPEDANIASLLDSKFEAEKVQGLKRLIALLSQGVDVSNFFPQVVKNVASTSLEIKKLVYIYLVHYAERRPDEALLSINSFQKDLSDLNPLVRGWSLRAMSGIRVRVVVPLVVMAVHKCSWDPSPYVRQCAAHAIPKIFALDREAHAEALEEVTVAAIIISFELGLSNFFQQRMMKIAT